MTHLPDTSSCSVLELPQSIGLHDSVYAHKDACVRMCTRMRVRVVVDVPTGDIIGSSVGGSVVGAPPVNQTELHGTTVSIT